MPIYTIQWEHDTKGKNHVNANVSGSQSKRGRKRKPTNQEPCSVAHVADGCQHTRLHGWQEVWAIPSTEKLESLSDERQVSTV